MCKSPVVEFRRLRIETPNVITEQICCLRFAMVDKIDIYLFYENIIKVIMECDDIIYYMNIKLKENIFPSLMLLVMMGRFFLFFFSNSPTCTPHISYEFNIFSKSSFHGLGYISDSL